MNKRIRRDLLQSKKDFHAIVWPAVRDTPLLGGGRVIDIEGGPVDGLLRTVDIRGGVDYLQLPDKYKGVRFLASRIQYGYSYHSFTLRYRKANGAWTEYDKLRNNKQSKCIYPNVFIQAYIMHGKLVNAGVITTDDLLEYILITGRALDIRLTQDRTEFVVVPWDSIRRSGIYMEQVDG